MRSNTEASRRLVLEKIILTSCFRRQHFKYASTINKEDQIPRTKAKVYFLLGCPVPVCLVCFSLYALACEQETESRKDQARKTENLENHTHNSAEYTDQYTEKCDA